MLTSKALSDAGWKDVAAKNKVKDNGLSKALEKLKRVDDKDHDGATKVLDEIDKLAAALKKDKAVASIAAAAKYLGEILDAAGNARRDVAKARAEAEKKAAAEAARKADEDEDEDEGGASPELLTNKLKPLLKLVAKGETMHALLGKSGKKVVVMLSRKPISPARRKMLQDELGGGSTKFYPGTCGLVAGATTFALKAEVAGMSKLVKAALLEQTGLRLNKIKCRGEDGDDHDDDDDGDDDDKANAPAADPTASAAPPAGGAPASPAQAADLNDVLSDQTGAPTRVQRVSASVTLAGGQVIGSDAEQVIKTGEATRVTISVDTTRLTVRFDPELQVVRNDLLSTTVRLQHVYFDYHRQTVGSEWVAPRYANWFGGIGQKIKEEIEKNLIAHVPKQMLAKGYNPFDDAKLESQLPEIAAKLLPRASGSGPKVNTSDARLHADVVVAGELKRPPLSIPGGTSVSLDLELRGGIPESLADAEIASVRIAFTGSGAHVNYTMLGTDVPAIFIHGAMLSHGGHLSLDYVLAPEAIESLLRVIMVAAAQQGGQRVGAGALDGREPKLRAIVDKEIKTHLEPLLRELIVKHNSAIAGLDLAKALGM